MAQRWGVVVPVKLLALAKTRLAPYGDAARADLALAFADDVVAAAAACPGVQCVLVVTDDVRAAAALARPDVAIAADLPGAGLNPALAHGADLLRAATPDLGVVAVASDLPALRSSDLASALEAVVGRAFVADTAGVGTTLLAAGTGIGLSPAYGADSRVRHLASGAHELVGAPGLRRDVDTPQDLEQALRIGVGRRTAAVVARMQG